MNQQDIINGLNTPERIASAIGQLPDNERTEITALVAGEQKPGTFGDLIQRAVAGIENGKKLEGSESNVISMAGKCSAK